MENRLLLAYSFEKRIEFRDVEICWDHVDRPAFTPDEQPLVMNESVSLLGDQQGFWKSQLDSTEQSWVDNIGRRQAPEKFQLHAQVSFDSEQGPGFAG